VAYAWDLDTASSAPELLERTAEIGVLDDALHRARRGLGSLVVVEGPSGIGKSSLLGGAARRANHLDMPCLRGRGAELEAAMPFGVARQLLGPALAAMDAAERAGHLQGLAAGAGSVLGSTDRTTAQQPMDQAGVVDALFWLIDGVARSSANGVLVAVDDAQWADASSLRVLVRLAVALEELPVAVMVALRTEERDPGQVLARLRGYPAARIVRPAALSEDAVGTLVRAGLGQHAAAELGKACAVATGGNPFLAGELIASLRADGVAPNDAAAAAVAQMVPESVLHSVLLRLARLSEEASALAKAATVVGPGAPLRHGLAVAGLGATDGETAAEALVAAGLLTAADPLNFIHPMINEAVAADMTGLARARAHRRAALTLAGEDAPDQRVAAHLRRSTPSADPWVVGILRSAAAEAMQRGEAPGALRLLERAVAEPPTAEVRPELLVEVALAEAANGSAHAIDRLAEVPELTDDPRRRARALHAISRLLLARGQVAAAVQAAERARTELDPDDPLAVRILSGQLAVMFFAPGRWDETNRLLGDLENRYEAGLLPVEPMVLAQLATRRAVWAGEGAARVRPLAEAALAVRSGADELWQGDASMAAAVIFVGEFGLAERVLERMAEHARRTASPVAASLTGHWLATLRHLQGRVGEAATAAQSVLDGEGLGWSLQTAWSAAVLALARLELDDLNGARAAIASTEGVDPTLLPYGVVLQARAEVALATGDAPSAVRDFTAAGAHLREQFSLANPAVLAWRSGAARALLALGDRDRAADLAGAELVDARLNGTPHAIGGALRAVAATATRNDRRIALLEEAVGLLAGSGADLEHMRVLCDLGAALRRARRTSAARVPLEAALTLARGLGATAIAARAYRELRVGGARPKPAGAAALLTPGERQVAELAAQDYSNAQIAQRLHITPRTVEWHLTQTYRKLAIRSRTGLASALERVAT